MRVNSGSRIATEADRRCNGGLRHLEASNARGFRTPGRSRDSRASYCAEICTEIRHAHRINHIPPVSRVPSRASLFSRETLRHFPRPIYFPGRRCSDATTERRMELYSKNIPGASAGCVNCDRTADRRRDIISIISDGNVINMMYI